MKPLLPKRTMIRRAKPRQRNALNRNKPEKSVLKGKRNKPIRPHMRKLRGKRKPSVQPKRSLQSRKKPKHQQQVHRQIVRLSSNSKNRPKVRNRTTEPGTAQKRKRRVMPAIALQARKSLWSLPVLSWCSWAALLQCSFWRRSRLLPGGRLPRPPCRQNRRLFLLRQSQRLPNHCLRVATPAEQDRDWKKVPNIKPQYSVRYAGKNSSSRDIEFLSLDAGNRRVQLVGRADRRSIVTSYPSRGRGTFRNVRYLNTDPEKAFIFADYPQRDVSTVLISPKNEKSAVSAYHYFAKRKPDKKTGVFKKGYSLEYAVKDGGLMALLLQNTESYSQNMLVSNEKGKTEAYRIWSDPYDLSNYSDYGSHIALDVHSKDGIKQGTVLVSGSRSTLFAPSQSYLNGIRVKAQSSSLSLEGTKAQIFKPQDILPKGVFQKYTSLGGGIRMTAAAVNSYRKSLAMGGKVWGMGNQKNKDGSSRADAYLIWTIDGKTDLRRMFVRNDSNWHEGVTIRDLEFYGNGQLAVLLRENEGKPYSAVVFFDQFGNLKNRYSL